ncbi:helicase-related protein [Terrisporobacter othiniensis]|uniref:helicase-related protein n=1 Tax=Terrisporobacter othiniensis TaxID=1577792 RepID=UPI002915EF4F|nr:helicase-related protein [Terrisporobacter othiniensis]
MNYKNMNFKSSYETGQDDLLESFYIPVLENAIQYDRIAGFFSSSSLAIASKGLVGLIKNRGKMRLIACPQLQKDDVEIIKQVYEGEISLLEKNLINSISSVEDEFENNHVKALGWMLSKGFLEIKIAIPVKTSMYAFSNTGSKAIFHQKVGILKDKDGNKISFSGSINETALGWIDNIEEFKVFKSWVTEQNNYLLDDIKKFNEFWNNERNNVKVVDLPNAVKEKLIKKSKDFDINTIDLKMYKKAKKVKQVKDKLSLFFYQKDAINKWKDNNYKLLFQMATGTGKTRTAIGCTVESLNISNKLLIIVSCPQGTLSLQWKREIDELNLGIDYSEVIDGTNKKWKDNLEEILLKISIGYYDTAIIYTTHITCSKEDFIQRLKKRKSNIKTLFIGDEVHGLGATKTRLGLLEEYDYRVGLSATPSRWFDESGTYLLEEYFGNESFEFSISDALTTINPLTGKTFLVNYYYNIEFVKLDDDEIQSYKKLSSDIRKLKLCKQKSEDYADIIERLLFKRANIIKNAINKYEKLQEILHNMEKIEDLIIFVSSEQLEGVLKILSDMKVPAHKLTQNEGTTPNPIYNGLTEREYIINKFKERKYKVLVAIKCLDEGIDIPSASKAILMANSTNPREYVQRIGRVIRQNKDKKYAVIYDISIEPSYNRIDDEDIRTFEKMVCAKERIRLEEIALNAINNADAILKIENTMGE